MKIFLSHSHSQAATADALAIALRQDGHEVFLDTDALKAADGYHSAIREQIDGCDLFLFLISPQALEAGKYALTELGMARARWPDPSGHVLPVMAVDTPLVDLPPYLKSVTVLTPKGDLVAETAARVAALRGRPTQGRLTAALAVLALATGGLWFWQAGDPGPPAPCLLDVTVPDSAAVATLQAGRADAMRSFVVVGGAASLDVDVDALTASGGGWIIEATAPGGFLVGRFNVAGCPADPMDLLDERTNLRLRLAPRP